MGPSDEESGSEDEDVDEGEEAEEEVSHPTTVTLEDSLGIKGSVHSCK